MISRDAAWIAREAGGELVRSADGAPTAAAVDSRETPAGALFVGLAGSQADGGTFAALAMSGGAWGALVAPAHVEAALAEHGAVIAAADPLAALGRLAAAWRRELAASGTRIFAITGSTGKTSTKDILAALLRRSGLATVQTPGNWNTEIGLPLVVLGASEGTGALVLELAMRGPGQIAELTRIADPDIGLIVNVGPAHIELLGSIEAIAAAKAELIAGLRSDAAAVIPAGSQLLAPHLRSDLRTVTFGDGGDVRLEERGGELRIIGLGRDLTLSTNFAQRHQLGNLAGAVAAAWAAGIEIADGELEVAFSALRGERHALAGGIVLIDDSYNANPDSMRAAIDELCRVAAGRRIALLGEMLELGEHAPALHAAVGEHAMRSGVDVVIAVGEHADEIAGPLGERGYVVPDSAAAAELALGLLADGDTVLVKGSRGVRMDLAAARLREAKVPA